MSILDQTSKDILVEAMRRRLCGILKESTTLTSRQATDRAQFINENASYEQLLNITLNPLRESKYLPAYVLEGAVAIIHRACLSDRTVIGENALTEGALKLQKETGAVITESMLNAAKVAVHDGIGLHIVGDILKESVLLEDVLDAVYGADKTNLVRIQGKLRRGDPGALNSAYQFIDRTFGSNVAKAERYKDLIKDNPSAFLKTMSAHAVRRAGQDPTLSLAAGSKFRKQVRERGTNFFKDFGKNISKKAPNVPVPPLTTPSQRAYDAARGISGGGKMGLLTKAALAGGALGLGVLGWNAYKNNKAAQEDY